MGDSIGGDLEVPEADRRFAVFLVKGGAYLPEVKGRLLARGLTPGQVNVLLEELKTQVLPALAVEGLDQDKPLAAKQVVEDVEKARRLREELLFNAVTRLSSGGRGRDIEAELLAAGVSPEVARSLLLEAIRMTESMVRKMGLRNIGIGLGMLTLGVALTLASLGVARHVGVWVIQGGTVLGGLVLFIVGVVQWISGRDVV